MINGLKEMQDFADDQLDLFGYWDSTLTDPRDMTVMGMVKEFAYKTNQVSDTSLYQKLIAEEYEEWLDCKPSTTEDLKELADLVYVIYGYAKSVGYDLDEAIRRVHKNNLGRCLQPDGTVQYRADGKILKNPDFPKVDLSDLM